MNTTGQAPASTPNPCLARQPILTKDERVEGYELLFRENSEDNRFEADVENATSSIIDTLNVMGLDAICDGRLGFINCTRQMLLKELFLLLPSDKIVLEIQQNVAADDSVLGACQRLQHKSYSLALDNFVPHDPRAALVPYVDFLKVDIRRFTSAQSKALCAQYARQPVRLIAQEVETRLQMITADKDGFTLFQGYFFRRPERMRARHIPANQASYLRLLQVISAPEVDLAAVENLIKHDASLCYRLLRYLNSPLLGVSSPVRSIRHGMNLLGERELVRWIRMATTLAMGQDKCSDLVLSSLVRAHFCELIAPRLEHGTADLFLMGMLSLMDAILEIPMGVVVEGLALDARVKEQLLQAKIGHESPLAPVYQLMLAREAGQWEDVTAFAKKLNLSPPFVNRAYTEAMAWAREMTAGLAPAGK
ncbi:MAG: HDOD domain-containing protein [Candidatus Sulfotelmatobacter sp.]